MKEHSEPSKEERKKLLIEMMQEDEKNGMYEKSDNELIAEFMGYYINRESHNAPVIYYPDGDYSYISDAGFELYWDRIMPVVEKISEYRMAYPKETGWVCDCKIVVIRKYLYREVVQFIKFYNSQQHERK